VEIDLYEIDQRFLESADAQETRLYWLIQDALLGSEQNHFGSDPHPLAKPLIEAALTYIPEAMKASDPSVYASRLDAFIPPEYADHWSPYRDTYETAIEMIGVLRGYRRIRS
jgi:hypothetical protein